MKTLYTILKSLLTLLPALLLPTLLPNVAMAAEHAETRMDLTNHWIGFLSIALFVLAYVLVMAEEFTHLRKSKPVILGAGIIWGIIGWFYVNHGMTSIVEHAVRHNLLEYAELMLFLLVAMTYINAMDERNVFDTLRSWLVRRGFGFRTLWRLPG